MKKAWSRSELLVAFALYCQLPFGKLHARNPIIVECADAIGRTPSALAMKLANIASLDPSITRTGRTGLSGASTADRLMWEEMQSDWLAFSVAMNDATVELNVKSVAIEKEISDSDQAHEGFSRVAQVNVRVGQAFFRKSVLSAYGQKCCITGLSDPRLLVASHIVPWKDDSKNRLNPSNGLCLSALHDKAFDLGLISLDMDFRVIIASDFKNYSDNFLRSTILDYAGHTLSMPEKFRPSPDFIEYHRTHIFQG